MKVTEQSLSALAESFSKRLVEVCGDSLSAVSLFGADETLNSLFASHPGILILLKNFDETVYDRLNSMSFNSTLLRSCPILLYTVEEMRRLELERPLDMLYIKYSNSVVYGDDFAPHIWVNREAVQGNIIREIYAVLGGLRNSIFLASAVDDAYLVREGMKRLLKSFRGIVFLRHSGAKSLGWSTLINTIESSCGLSDMTLSRILSAQENRDERMLASLKLPFIKSLSEIAEKVSSFDILES